MTPKTMNPGDVQQTLLSKKTSKIKKNVNFGYTPVKIPFTNIKDFLQELDFDQSAVCYNDLISIISAALVQTHLGISTDNNPYRIS